jgi:hypothetical protein
LLHTLLTTYLLVKINLTSYKDKVVSVLKYSCTHDLKFALDGGVWPASQPGRSSHGVIGYNTHWVGDWVDLRTGFDAVQREKSAHARLQTPKYTVLQPVA